eukprot:4438106-Prymnesium_polylepis.1
MATCAKGARTDGPNWRPSWVPLSVIVLDTAIGALIDDLNHVACAVAVSERQRELLKVGPGERVSAERDATDPLKAAGGAAVDPAVAAYDRRRARRD